MKLRKRGKGKRGKHGKPTRRQRQVQEMRPWIRYYLGRILQVTGLIVTLVAGTAFFGTRSTTAMLRLMLAGVVIFLPGWWLARKNPRATGTVPPQSGR